MFVRLEVNGHAIGARVPEVADIAPRVLDHEVDVERQPRGFANGFDHHRSERQIRYEGAIHHVDVDPVGAALLGRLDCLRQMPKVRVQNRWRDLDAHTPSAMGRFFSARRSWPHAARMSRPRFTLMVAAMPACRRRVSNASARSVVGARKRWSSDGFIGIKLTWHKRPRSSSARSSASSSESLTPAISVYS